MVNTVLRVAAVLALALLGGAFPTGSQYLFAQASAYVPNLDPAYAELDALIASGLIREVLVGQRPYSRMTFARMVREARSNMEDPGARAPSARILEALARGEAMFEPELARMCEGGGR